MKSHGWVSKELFGVWNHRLQMMVLGLGYRTSGPRPLTGWEEMDKLSHKLTEDIYRDGGLSRPLLRWQTLKLEHHPAGDVPPRVLFLRRVSHWARPWLCVSAIQNCVSFKPGEINIFSRVEVWDLAGEGRLHVISQVVMTCDYRVWRKGWNQKRKVILGS